MKKHFGKSAILIVAVCLAATAVACSGGGFERGRTSYEIVASYDESAKTITAEMVVDYVNSGESVLDEVCFHLYPAAFREGARFSAVPAEMTTAAYPNGVSYGGITIDSLTVGGAETEIKIEGQDEDILVVPTGAELYPGDRVKIAMNFTLAIPNVRHRFGYMGETVNLGNWYPIACVYENGNFVTDPYYSAGDPFYSECADYSVSLAVPNGFTAAMSGYPQKSEENGMTVFRSKISRARDFAAVIGRFKMLGTTVDGVPVNYYYVGDQTPAESLAAAADALRTFDGLFGKYPYESYSAVETAFLHGGMEYPALAMISDELNGEMYREAIIHETAHQWWYAAVGNNEVADAWMDEGLAEFSASVFYERNPSYDVDYEKRMADALGSYVLYYDSNKNVGKDTSMTRRISEYSGQFEYTYMTYVKGELMFEALRELLGDEKFFKCLADYYERYKFAVATPDDMIGSFEKSSSRQLKSFFDSWLDGKVACYDMKKG